LRLILERNYDSEEKFFVRPSQEIMWICSLLLLSHLRGQMMPNKLSRGRES